MMRPQSALFYTEKLQDVADDFVKYVEQKRRSDLTNPGDFLDDLHDLALEHITAIALDTRDPIQIAYGQLDLQYGNAFA